jgi:hypothetical protein
MERRPLDVVLAVVYCAGFSAALVGMLAVQIIGGHIHGTWREKAVVLPMAFLLAIIPGGLALGLWLLDNAARLTAIFFTLLHAIAEVAFLGQPQVPWRAFTIPRIVMDGLIIACLCRSHVRKIFKDRSVGFSPRCGSSPD